MMRNFNQKNKDLRIKAVSEKIISHTNSLDKTCEIYNEVLSFILKVVYQEFSLSYNEDIKRTVPIVEKLINKTSKNPNPKYTEYNQRFPKFPCYFRRAAIAAAYGKWLSWRSNYLTWEKERLDALEKKKSFSKSSPTLQLKHNEFPVFYKGNMFNQTEEGYEIKIYKNNDWVWEKVIVRSKVNLVKRGIKDWKQCNPKLIKKGKKYFLSFTYEKVVKLHNIKEKNVRILAIHLGESNSAVCCVMENDGTVLDRLFINQPKEKDHQFHLINQLRKAQQKTREATCPRYWNTVKGLQKQIINNTAYRIIKFAVQNNVNTIVFEYLGRMRLSKDKFGARKLQTKLRHWRKIKIQNRVTEMAHCFGIRISRVLTRGASVYSFDGKGKISCTEFKDICKFEGGKYYHRELNTSYNIGARYFIRAYIKSLSEKRRLALEAKVPEVLLRTEQTLSTLRQIHMYVA